MASHPAYLVFDEQELYFEVVTSENTDETAEPTDHPVEQGADVTDHVRHSNPTMSLEVVVSNTPVRDVNGWYDQRVEPVTIAIEGVALPPLANNADAEAKLSSLKTTTDDLMRLNVVSAIGSALDTARIKSAYDEAKGALQRPDIPGRKVTANVRKFTGAENAVRDVVGLLEEWKTSSTLGQIFFPWRAYDNIIITRVGVARTPEDGDSAKISIEFRRIRFVEAKSVDAPLPSEIRGKKKVSKGHQPLVPEPDATKEPKASIAKKVLQTAGIDSIADIGTKLITGAR